MRAVNRGEFIRFLENADILETYLLNIDIFPDQCIPFDQTLEDHNSDIFDFGNFLVASMTHVTKSDLTNVYQ